MANKKSIGIVWKAMALLAVVLAIMCLVSNCGTEKIAEEVIPLGGYTEGFICARGDSFYDDKGIKWQIRSIGFGNACWSNHDGPVYSYCDESSYQELAELGFNTVRFYLNYGMFEQDEKPYAYNETAFLWLDQNVAWAAKYGIRILFNMHFPQGGFQSAGEGLDLWRNQNDEQDRLVALWGAIAQRYADDPTVLGYGLVNEPYLLWLGSKNATLAQWEKLAQSITNEIRKADKKHILFLEPAMGAIEPYSQQTTYVLNDNYNLISVNDPADNVAYEMHFYQPMAFTHMQGSNADSWVYPDASRAVFTGNDLTWAGNTYPSHIKQRKAAAGGDGWYYVETDWISPSQYGCNLMTLTMSCLNLNSEARVYLDDLNVKVKSEDGTEEKIIYKEDFSRDNGWTEFNNSGGESQYAYVQQEGHEKDGCLRIEGASSYSVLQKKEPNYIAMQDGCVYKVFAWIKVEGDTSAQVFPQMSFYSSKSSGAFTKEYMENLFVSYAEAAHKQGGPLFIGEFGILPDAYDYGGEKWLEDVLSVFKSNNISYSYHLYHGGDFALYPNSSYTLPDTPNGVLYDIFQRLVG